MIQPQLCPGRKFNAGCGAAIVADLIVASQAVQGIAAAHGWYEGQRFGLDEEFPSRVGAGIQSMNDDESHLDFPVENFLVGNTICASPD